MATARMVTSRKINFLLQSFQRLTIVSRMSDTPRMIPVTIRVCKTDLEDWTRCAKLRGMSLSEWLRRAAHVRRAMDESVAKLTSVPVELRDSSWHKLTGAFVKHHPRCTCLACKPEKKKAARA